MSATLEQLEGMADDAYERGKAAGRAAAVADLRRWLVLEVKSARGERKRARYNEYSRLIGILDIGAHVGAANGGAK